MEKLFPGKGWSQLQKFKKSNGYATAEVKKEAKHS